jgi:AcrR family transcriptional regulator
MEKATTKRKEREREARREAILDAAARVFARKGFHAATLDEIAVEAELAKGTLYNYYEDKQDLFTSLIARGHRYFEELLNDLNTQDKSLRELLVLILSAALRGMMEQRYIYRLILTSEFQVRADQRAVVSDVWRSEILSITARLADLLAQIPETQGLSPADRLTGAKLILSSLRYLFLIDTREEDLNPPTEEIENFVRLLSRALTVEHIS